MPLAFSLYPAARGATLDVGGGPADYGQAEFRLWYPDDAGSFRAVVVLVPGSNGDGRAIVDDAAWETFAVKHKLALVGPLHG